MKFGDQITALVLTWNEAPNLRRTLEALTWAKEILVLDSFSTDETLLIAREFPNVEVLQCRFDSFAEQCNWGLSQIKSEWALSLDADYVLTDELVAEIITLPAAPEIAGYSARFRYCIGGVPLRKTILLPRTLLYRRSRATYENEGHGHRVRIDGATRELNGYILHDDRKPLRRWLQSQISYAEIEARHLLSAPASEISFRDRVRKVVVPAPFLVLGYTLFGQLLILDGWRGWYYVFQRTLAELLLSLRLMTLKFGLEEEKKSPTV